MIIFGTRGITTTVERGNFLCPSCSRNSYEHKRVRRFFTLFFIPLIPLDVVGEYIECEYCKGTYDMLVLGYEQEHRRAMKEIFTEEFDLAFKRVLLFMMMADGEVDEAEIVEITEVYQEICGKALDPEVIRAEATLLAHDDRTVAGTIDRVDSMLNDEGRKIILRGAAMVAFSDQDFDATEEALLFEIAEAMGLGTADVDAVVAEMNSVGSEATAEYGMVPPDQEEAEDTKAW